MLRPPEGVEVVRWANASAWVRPEVKAWVLAHLTRYGTLDRASAHEDDAIVHRGRGLVHAIPGPGTDRLVVRPYRRGGWIARVSRDRFLRIGTPRPFRELRATSIARERGVPTPRVVAAVVHHRAWTYAGEIVSEYVPGSVDLAGFLFHDRWPGSSVPADVELRHEVLRQAGACVAILGREGVLHRDLNAKNLLVQSVADEVRMYVLDLDRARIHPGPLNPGVMAARLERSMRKFEERTGRGISAAGWTAFREGLADGRLEGAAG